MTVGAGSGPEMSADAGRATDWPALIGVIAAVSVFAIAQGLTYPLLSFILAENGASPTTVGLSAAMTPLGLIASSPCITWLARRIGASSLVLGSVVLATAVLTLLGAIQNVWVWFPLRFLLGAAINPLFVLSEAWMIVMAAPRHRGRAMGLYAATLSAGYAAGPFTLLLIGTKGFLPFLVGLAAFATCGMTLSAIRRSLPDLGGREGSASIRRFVVLAPMLLFAVLLAAAFEQAYLSLMPVYGFGYGLKATQISGFIAVLIVGNVALQVPLGLAAERWRPRAALVVCSALTAAGCLIQPLLMGTPAMWVLAFFLGALSYGAYTVALVELGERFSGSMLVAGNASFALMWGLGSLVGPMMIGAAMDLLGIQSLPLAFAGLLFAFAALSGLALPPPRREGVRRNGR